MTRAKGSSFALVYEDDKPSSRMSITTPAHIARRHLDSMLTHLPGALDGDVESVHQARVATRRLREVVPLIDDRPPKIAEVLQQAGRQLGRVRELDVMGELMDSLGSRLPTAAAAEWHDARHAVRERQRSGRRRMVKALERLELESLRNAFSGHAWTDRWLSRPLFKRSWVELIWDRIASRSSEAVAAVERAPAVYFPNRTHQARIAVKKLRYTIELAADTGVWRHERVLNDLRRIQTLLGSVHDAQILMDTLDDLRRSPEPTTASTSFLKAVLDGEIDRQHARYAKRRDRIRQIAAACSRARADAHHQWRFPAPLIAASVFTAPVLIESVAPWSRRRRAIHG
jgi:CHAD domain-containing protein